MNIFQLIRAARARIATANHFELQVERAKAERYRQMWHEALERISEVHRYRMKAEKELKELCDSLANAGNVLSSSAAPIVCHECNKGTMVTTTADAVDAGWVNLDGLWFCRDHLPAAAPSPTHMCLWCPGCGARHIDVGEFATKVHHTHSCQKCGLTWRPAVVPGFKNKETKP